MKNLTKNLTLASILIVSIFLLTGCEKSRTTKFSKPSIKDDYCGVVMNYQYCKCAFHNELCDSVGLSSGAASSYVHDEYNKWIAQRKKDFKNNCEIKGGIYNGDNDCKYCEEPYQKQGNKCVKDEDIDEDEEEEENDDEATFVPDGPFDENCNIEESQFDKDWKKYSDFDNAIEFNSRSWEAQQHLGIYEKIIKLKVRNFELERDMEIDRQARLALRDYKTALVQNIRTNLLKSFWRLSYVTYSTIKSGQGVGTSYSTVLTSAETIPRISAALKVIQGVIPPSSSVAIDTSTVSGKVKSIGLNAALEAFDSMGDPVKIATQVFTDSRNAALPSADISPEEIAILRTQHLKNNNIDKTLAESYRKNAIRRMELLDNRQWIIVLEAEAASWEGKEKARVRGMLEADCQRQKDSFENDETSLLNIFINKAQAQESDENNIYTFGDNSIEYTEKNVEESGAINYYKDENLILSVYDTDEDSQADLWIQYDQDFYVILEAYDTTGDGQTDTTLDLDRDETVSNLVQPTMEIPEEYKEVVDENDLKDRSLVDVEENEEENEDGDSKNILWIVIILAIGVFVYMKKRNK
jgi:hypothetical protein